jgi:hypothetical protein
VEGAHSGLRSKPEQQEIAAVSTCGTTFHLSTLNGTEGYQISGEAGATRDHPAQTRATPTVRCLQTRHLRKTAASTPTQYRRDTDAIPKRCL